MSLWLSLTYHSMEFCIYAHQTFNTCTNGVCEWVCTKRRPASLTMFWRDWHFVIHIALATVCCAASAFLLFSVCAFSSVHCFQASFIFSSPFSCQTKTEKCHKQIERNFHSASKTVHTRAHTFQCVAGTYLCLYMYRPTRNKWLW